MAQVTSSLFIAQSVEILSKVFIVRAKNLNHAKEILTKKSKCRHCAWCVYPLINPRCGQALNIRRD